MRIADCGSRIEESTSPNLRFQILDLDFEAPSVPLESAIRDPQSAIRDMTVPFVDLQAQYRSIKGEIDAAIARVVESSAFVLGREVEQFEAAFAEYVGARFCVGVNSGTAAIQIALQACDIGAGDEVIVPANTFFATAEAVSTAGATPRFVDSDAVSYNIDPTKLEAAITERTRAILPVHLYGQPADLDAIFRIAARHNLIVIEDAAQAHGARYKGRRVGALARAGCFSFYPGKNLGAMGEGGAVVTNDEEIARRVRLLRDHGSERKYRHEIVGYNFRMEGIQGAVLAAKLPHLEGWNDLRRQHAARYNELLGALVTDGGDGGRSLTLPRESDYARHVYHLYVVQTTERDALQQHLAAVGVQTGIHYPVPVHLQPAYSSLGYREGDFPEAERQASRVLSLPMFAELTEEQTRRVAEAISTFVSGHSSAARG
jgi:dTDP-4-amino-4,6-dideoxygalactose transaminase